MKNIGSFEELAANASEAAILVNLCANIGLKFPPPTHMLGVVSAKAPFLRPDGSSDKDLGLFVEIGMAFGDDGTSVEAFARFVDRFTSSCVALRKAADGWFVNFYADDFLPGWFDDLSAYAHSLSAGDAPGRYKVEDINVFFSTALLILKTNARGERWQPPRAA